MRNNYEEVTKDVLRKMFVEENMKIVEIARTFGCSPEMISKRLIIYNLHTPRRMRKSTITEKDYDNLVQMKYMFNLNYSELSKAYDCTIQLIKKHLLIIKEEFPEKIRNIKKDIMIAKYAR